jgi:hypothetical protein
MTEERDNPDQALEIAAVAGPAEAQMIGELLGNNGIASTLQGPTISAPIPTISDFDEVRVLVESKDAARAKELIDSFFAPIAKDELVENQAELGVDDPDDHSGFTI